MGRVFHLFGKRGFCTGFREVVLDLCAHRASATGRYALRLIRTFLRHSHSGRIFTNHSHKCMNCSEVKVEHPVQPDRVIARLLQFVVVPNAEVVGDVE